MPRTRATCNPNFTMDEIEDNPMTIVNKRMSRRKTRAMTNNLDTQLNITCQTDTDLNSTKAKKIMTRSRGHETDVSENNTVQVPRKKKSNRNTRVSKVIDEQINNSQEDVVEVKRIIMKKKRNKVLNDIIQNEDNSFSSSDKENIDNRKSIQNENKSKNYAVKESPIIDIEKTENKKPKRKVKKTNVDKETTLRNLRNKKSSKVDTEQNSSKDTTFHSLDVSNRALNHDKSELSFISVAETLPEVQLATMKKISSLSLIQNDSILDKPSSTMIDMFIENEKKKMKGKRLPLANIRISGIEEITTQPNISDVSILKYNSTYSKLDEQTFEEDLFDSSTKNNDNTFSKNKNTDDQSEVSTMKRENTFVKEDQNPVNLIDQTNISTLKRERTFTKEENDQTLNQNSTTFNDVSSFVKKHKFEAATVCSLFKSREGNVSKSLMKTPPKLICQSISFGSAGCTPRPRKSKSAENESNERPDSTPKNKARILNVTHSMEKPDENHYIKDVQTKPVNRVTFNSSLKSPIAPFALNMSNIIKSNLKYSNKKTNHQISDKNNIVKKSNIIKKNCGISKLPKKTKTHISQAKSQLMSNLIQSTYGATPSKDNATKIVQPVSRTKMPNFASLHKKQFDQMESLIQNKARKEERAKQLFSATTPNYMKGTKSKESPVKKCVQDSMPPPPINFTRFGFKIDTDKYKNLPSVNYKDSPRPKISTPHRSANKNQYKDVMKDKMVAGIVEKNRTISRDYISGVRTNRRFELQMKARNLSST